MAQEAPQPQHDAAPQASLRSESDPVIARLERFADHPKVPALAGSVAVGLANHRRNVSDWSQTHIGDRSPLHGRITEAQGRAEERRAAMDQKLDDQNTRLRDKFGPEK